jgi:hypothetical protein
MLQDTGQYNLHSIKGTNNYATYKTIHDTLGRAKTHDSSAQRLALTLHSRILLQALTVVQVVLKSTAVQRTRRLRDFSLPQRYNSGLCSAAKLLVASWLATLWDILSVPSSKIKQSISLQFETDKLHRKVANLLPTYTVYTYQKSEGCNIKIRYRVHKSSPLDSSLWPFKSNPNLQFLDPV